MVINSINFFIFFVIFFLVYYFPLKENTKAQNVWLLIASYTFYGITDLKMLPVLIIATLVFYFLGILIHNSKERKASLFTTIGVVAGIALLVYFKYLNFFIDSFTSLFISIGLNVNPITLNILFPLGISFFTFRLISYIIEVHRRKIEPTRDIIVFASYIAFFPTLIAGPIDRPNDFIPQLKSKRSFNYDLAVDGTRQILWGIFKKMVIADNMAIFIGDIWSGVGSHSTPTLILAALIFPIHMYADFSGYSDMAIGVGKILGFRVAANFKYPFFARNIAEYWRTWHITLTSWVTDYVFMPLNVRFRNFGNAGIIMAIIINMIIIGVWHGANWTYAVFGLYHGLLYIPIVLSGSFGKKKKLVANKYGFPKGGDFIKMISTFLLVSLGLIIFNAPSLSQVVIYVQTIFSFSGMTSITAEGLRTLAISLFFSVIMIIAEWKQRNKEYALQIETVIPRKLYRYALYWIMLILIVLLSGEEQIFIYMQF